LIERLRIAFLGRRLPDAIKPDLDALAAKAGEISNECYDALTAASALRTKVVASSDAAASAEANLIALGGVLEAFDGHETRIHDLVAKFHELEHSVLVRLEDLSAIYRPSDSEKTRLLEEVEAIRRPATDLHAQFLHDFMSLERLWQQWSPIDQRHQKPEQVSRRRA